MQLSFEFKQATNNTPPPAKKQEEPQPLPADDPWESLGYSRKR